MKNYKLKWVRIALVNGSPEVIIWWMIDEWDDTNMISKEEMVKALSNATIQTSKEARIYHKEWEKCSLADFNTKFI